MTSRIAMLGMAATLCTPLSALFAPAAHAAKSAELMIMARVMPSPCIASFANGGTFDYQDIRAAKLNHNTFTPLPPMRSKLTVSCPSPIKFAVKVHDNRITQASRSSPLYYGLGTVGDADIGICFIHLLGNTLVADKEPARLLYRDERDWRAGYAGMAASPAREFSWNKSLSSNYPASFQHVGVDVEVQPMITATEYLPITDDIKLDGSATFELRYL